MGILENKAVKYGKDLTEFRRKTDPETFKQIDINLPDYKYLLICFKSGWDKLNNYYDRIGDFLAYAASVLLYPAYKWRYFIKRWSDRQDWIKIT